MSELNTFDQFLQNINNAEHPNDVTEQLALLDQLEAENKLSVYEVHQLRLIALRNLQQLTIDNSTFAADKMLNYLLAHCITVETNETSEISSFRRQYRDILRDWLDQYPEQERYPLREQVLSYLKNHITTASIKGICWTISNIGYRDESLLDLLWKIVESQDNEDGDTALNTIVNLGITNEHQQKASKAFINRARQRINLPLIGVGRKLSDPATIEVVLSFWLKPVEREQWLGLPSYALRILVDIADLHFENKLLQQKIWTYLRDLFEQFPEVLGSDILLGGDLGPRCNSQNVVFSFLTWLAAASIQQMEFRAHERWLIYHRLEQCIRPRHMLGWSNFDASLVESVVKRDALTDTKQKGLQLTMEGHTKKQALECLMRLGYKESLSWLEEGLKTETDPFMQQALCNHFARFRLDHLPQTIIDWIVEPYKWQINDRSSFDYAKRFGAIRVATSVASEEAFKALLNFGFTADGSVLLDSSTALATVAISLIKQGYDAIGDLIDVALNASETHHRSCALWVLKILAGEGTLTAERVELLLPLVKDPQSQLTVVSILGYIAELNAPKDLMENIRAWAWSDDKHLVKAAVEFLAQRNLLIQDHSLLEKQLGFKLQNDQWELQTDSVSYDWVGSIVVMLYQRYPKIFTPALVSLIKSQDWFDVFPIIEFLTDLSETASEPLSREIIDALIERVRVQHKRSIAEPDLIYSLGTLAPERLSSEFTTEDWTHWLPTAREALIHAISQVQSDKEIVVQAISSIVRLTQDSQYRVRRAAFRGLSQLSTESLQTLCVSLAQAESVELRERSAEAIAWLSEDESSLKLFEELFQNLKTDPEPTVRTAAWNSFQERRKRQWATMYLSYVLKVTGESNDEVLSAGCYGQALIRVGDDTTLNVLRQHLAKSRILWPNVRYWISEIIKELEKEWQKTVQKWPEPSFAFSGSIEEVSGKLRIRNKLMEAKFSLWLQPASKLSEVSSWGGAALVEDEYAFLGGADDSAINVEFEDGRKGKVLGSQYRGNTMIFWGQGAYPSN